MDSQTIWTAIKTYKSVKSFIEDGAISTILQEIGDVSFETASRELSQFHLANDKKASLNRAIVSLESALTAYRKNLPNSSFDEVKSENQADAKRRKFRVAYATVILCYLYIEEWELAQKKVNDYDPYLYITRWDDRDFLDAVKEMYGFMLMAGKIMIMGGGDYDSDYRKSMDEFINNAKNIIDKKG